jgi:dynein heavy chain
MKVTKSPSAGLLLVAQVLCLIFNVKPKVIRAQTAKEVDKMDYWEPTLKTLLKPELLKMMQTFDKDNVPAELVISLKPILESPDYTEEKMAKTSQAALGISNWTKAIVQYDEAMKVVKPKQQQLKEAEEASAKAQASLDIAQENLARVEANFAKLIAELDAAKAFEQSKRQEKEDKEYKLDLANNLINKLGSERDNWVIQLA